MALEHTKGKWNVNLAQPYDEHDFEVSYDTEDGLTYPIADIHGKLERGDAEANAHLIAAAPNMYEALKKAMLYLEYATSGNFQHGGDKPVRANIAKALAKAEGK